VAEVVLVEVVVVVVSVEGGGLVVAEAKIKGRIVSGEKVHLMHIKMAMAGW